MTGRERQGRRHRQCRYTKITGDFTQWRRSLDNTIGRLAALGAAEALPRPRRSLPSSLRRPRQFQAAPFWLFITGISG